MSKDIGHMREHYNHSELLESNVCTHPIDQFSQWFDEIKSSDIKEPNAMVVSTASVDGVPSSRTILLKEFGKFGFIFYTNYTSQKANEIESNQNVALLFLWKEMERQVRIIGKANKVSRDKSVEYFNSRPKGSRIGAIVSNQSAVIKDRLELEQLNDKFQKQYEDTEEIPCPKDWGGYLVEPTQFEFWQGRPNRLHDRIRYSISGTDTWKIERLAP